jgi:hypothetical protein
MSVCVWTTAWCTRPVYTVCVYIDCIDYSAVTASRVSISHDTLTLKRARHEGSPHFFPDNETWLSRNTSVFACVRLVTDVSATSGWTPVRTAGGSGQARVAVARQRLRPTSPDGYQSHFVCGGKPRDARVYGMAYSAQRRGFSAPPGGECLYSFVTPLLPDDCIRPRAFSVRLPCLFPPHGLRCCERRGVHESRVPHRWRGQP